MEERLDFVECEAGLLRESQHIDAPNGVRIVKAASTHPRGLIPGLVPGELDHVQPGRQRAVRNPVVPHD
jgi:hypothetical protein